MRFGSDSTIDGCAIISVFGYILFLRICCSRGKGEGEGELRGRVITISILYTEGENSEREKMGKKRQTKIFHKYDICKLPHVGVIFTTIVQTMTSQHPNQWCMEDN